MIKKFMKLFEPPFEPYTSYVQPLPQKYTETIITTTISIPKFFKRKPRYIKRKK